MLSQYFVGFDSFVTTFWGIVTVDILLTSKLTFVFSKSALSICSVSVVVCRYYCKRGPGVFPQISYVPFLFLWNKIRTSITEYLGVKKKERTMGQKKLRIHSCTRLLPLRKSAPECVFGGDFNSDGLTDSRQEGG